MANSNCFITHDNGVKNKHVLKDMLGSFILLVSDCSAISVYEFTL